MFLSGLEDYGRDCSQLFRRYLQIMALLKPSTWFKKEPKKARLRHYAGAQTNRLLADWFGNSSSANREIKPALVTLRNRSRELARNHWIAVRALQIYRTPSHRRQGPFASGPSSESATRRRGRRAARSFWKSDHRG